MALLFGREWSRQELLDRVEDMSQLASVRHTRSINGPEQGAGAIELWNSSGLRLTLLPGRCLDIAYAEYKGIPLCFRGAAGELGPGFYEPQGCGWMRGFFAGLLTTCGLTFVGDPEVDEQEGNVELGCHGRISYAPAARVAVEDRWEGDDYVLRVSGRMRECTSLGVNLRLTRQIEMRLGQSRLILRDRVENLSRRHPAPLTIVYHCNMGFPLLDAGARLVLPLSRAVDRGGQEVSRQRYASVAAPGNELHDELFIHEPSAGPDGDVCLALVNEALSNGLGVYWRFRKSDLPILNQWRHFTAGEYVMGIEPGNCSVLGRKANRQAGTLQRIAPGERREFVLEIGILEGPEDIGRFEAECTR